MPQTGNYNTVSFQIRVESHLTHIITKKQSVPFLALTAPCKNWAMPGTASEMPQRDSYSIYSQERKREERNRKERKKKGEKREREIKRKRIKSVT